jgi:plastocyanin
MRKKSTPRFGIAGRASFIWVVLSLALLTGFMIALPIASAQSTVTVSIPNGSGSPSGAPGYAPDVVTVVIGTNNTVMWTQDDTGHNHTVTPKDQPAGGGWIAGSGNMVPKSTYSFTFTVPGTYNYLCAYHAWMTGTVIVKPATTTPEFPASYLAVTLFAVVAAVVVAASRLRPGVVGPTPP